MGNLSRIGVAIDADLLQKFDDLIAAKGYTNRSEAFRDLIRDELVEKQAEKPDANGGGDGDAGLRPPCADVGGEADRDSA
jgi:metal-responsive CopG/Arc/MetJ family transcriptional regulator